MRIAEGLAMGEPWYQSDHGIFLMYERPAMALISANAQELLGEVAHTERDDVDLVDPGRVADAALFLRGVVCGL